MEEELDIREILASGKELDKILVYAMRDKEVLKQVISYLDDDLWIVAKNALLVLLEVAKEKPELYEPLISKLMVMIRKSEAVPLTQEIARAFGVLSKEKPEMVRKVVPIIFASYWIGSWKIRVNMGYVLEEIMRANPLLLGDMIKDISHLLTSKESADKLAALNFISALSENGFRYISPFLPKLLNLLYDKDPIVRAAAVETLVELGAKNKGFRKIVLAKLQDLEDTDSLVNRKIKEGISRLSLRERSSF